MTYNFLCNTASLPGVHERLIFVTLDTVARDELRRAWPNIRQFHWPTPSLYMWSSFFFLHSFISSSFFLIVLTTLFIITCTFLLFFEFIKQEF
ncbi:hypothetical protein NECAME_19232 [Necator americanus]|uniref:Uncharacterized protein n=1 Tax=Necator americanus TaxID=51031 RepID=W2SQ74_NECAM|nr:hypothetical protein NECAME_19232 [Necator americanus]ETN71673.1 hypothetical protein NECAME_19232 [Necator americanus]